MNIIKASGATELFDSKKIYHTIREAGASNKLAKEAVRAVRSIIYEGITSEEILKFLLNFLKKEKGVSQRYNLKKAVMSLGPSGFPFERYFAKILDLYGYQTNVGIHLKGKRVLHEVDIVAIKNKKAMIECKYHNQSGISTGLQPAMYTYARFLDLKRHGFDFPWLVTNTKCSIDAQNYAEGVDLKITSWNYPFNESLLKLIENKKIYPITISNTIKKYELEKFFGADIITVRDLLELNVDKIVDLTGINKSRIHRIVQEVKFINDGASS